MKLKILFLLFMGAMLLILLLLGDTLRNFNHVQPAIQKLERERLHLHELIDELHRSSEELTSMARAYAATGDKRFESAFNEIVDIRYGQRPWSHKYSTYTYSRHITSLPDGLRIAYPDLLRRGNLAPEDIAALMSIFERTEQQIQVERQAIDLINTQQTAFAHRPAIPYVTQANQMLFSPAFLNEQAAIGAMVQQLHGRVEKLASERIAAPSQEQNDMVLLAGGLSLTLLSGLIWLAFWGWHQLIRPLAQMGLQAEGMARGDYSVRVEESGFNELKQLAFTFNDMANAIERDMHALRLTEARLANSERHYRTLFDGAADAILLRPLHKPYVDANPVACQRLGYRREDILGFYPRDITAPEACLDEEEIQALLRDKGWAIFNSISLARDGRRIPVEVSACLVDYEGEPTILSVHRDISERQALQNEVQQAKDYAEQLIETANVMVLALDEQGRVQIFNAAAERITGYKRAEVIGQDWFELGVPRARYPHVWETFASQHTMPASYENPILISSGQERLIDWKNSLLHDPFGGLTTISFGVDVTDARDAEKRMHQLVENAPIPMLLAENETGRVVFVNDRFQSVLGYAAEEIHDLKHWEELAYIDHEERPAPDLHLEQAGGEAPAHAHPFDALETLVRCHSGEERIFEVHHSLIGDMQLRMFVDLTEHWQAEQQIAELGELNKMVIDKTTSGIIVSNADGEVVLANEAGERILGAQPNGLIGFNLINSPVSVENGISLIANQALASGAPGHFNGQYVTSYGRRVWLDSDFLRIRLRGENFLLVVFGDLSNIKEAETVLIEAKRAAENANRSKSEFIANMSHEIRTPMNAVIGLAQLALGTDLNSKQRDYLEKIHFSSRSLLGILNDILDYSKIESGRLDIESVEFNLEEVLRNVSNLFMASADAKGLEMVYAIDPAVPGLLLGDPLRISQVFSNLVGNAIKFTERGEIDIFVNVLQQDGESLLLEGGVHDTGIGMSAAHMQVLFAPFSQGDASISRRYGGSGLGLAISRRLAEMMGGDISVDSEEGRGSTFRFTLRCGVAAPSEPIQKYASDDTPSNSGASMLSGAHILLVDDNEINQQVASEFLHQAGVKTTLAKNGYEALAWLEYASFDAILMDIHMPQMNGLEATRRLRADTRWATLPVVAMTAAVLPEDRQACMAAGMNDYIAKPIDPENLIRILQRWVALEPALNDVVPKNALPDLPGFDSKRIAAISHGDMYRLSRLLASFARDFSSAGADIEQLLQQGNWTAARQVVHAIKGASGNLGAMQLYQASCLLEADLQAEIASTAQPSFLQALDSVLRIAHGFEYAAEEKKSAAQPMNRQIGQRLLANMLTLLDEQELVPDELLLALTEQFSEYPALVQRMTHALGVFDFYTAKIVWSELMHVLENNGEE